MEPISFWRTETGRGQERGCQQAADLQQRRWGLRVGDSHHRLTRQQQQKRLHQQQQDQPTGVPAASPCAGHIFELYSECVLAGQWARFSVVKRQDGEYITLLIRPLAPAASAVAARAKRKGGSKPNLRRMEKKSERRRNHRRRQNKSGPVDQPQQQHQLQVPGSSSSCAMSRQQQQQQLV